MASTRLLIADLMVSNLCLANVFLIQPIFTEAAKRLDSPQIVTKIQCRQKFLLQHSLTYLKMCKTRNIECPRICVCVWLCFCLPFYFLGTSDACQIFLSKFEFGISLFRICMNPYQPCHLLHNHKIFAHRVSAVGNLSVLHLGFYLKQQGNILHFLPYLKWFCSPLLLYFCGVLCFIP